MGQTDYTTVGKVKTHVGLTSSDTGMDTWLEAMITACSRAIDSFCKRHFYTETETRYFDFQDPYRMWLDHDLVSITTLTNGNAEILVDGTDFYKYPLSGPPYRWLDAKTDTGNLFEYSSTTQRAISILGVWGYQAEVPAEIEEACRIWVGELYNRHDAEGVASKRIGDYSVSYATPSAGGMPEVVKAMIGTYRWRNYGR